MSRPSTLKNYFTEIKLYANRLFLMLFLLCILIIVLFSRLLFLQVNKHTYYTTLSTQNQVSILPLAPTRGLIYDRHGILLAANKPVFSLELIPAKLSVHLTKLLPQLKTIITLSDSDINDFYKLAKQSSRYDPIPLKIKLTNQEVAQFYVNQFRFPGVFIKAELLRFYPLGESASHIMGYVGQISETDKNLLDPVNYRGTHYVGKLGIEFFYEQLLHGKVGFQQAETDASGRIVRILQEQAPIAGNNLYLTIDANLQTTAEEALGTAKGAIVALNPQNGDILALVSHPTYNNNLFVQGIPHHTYEAFQKSPDHPLYNRALRGQYALASTIKPYLLLHALNNGTIDLNYQIDDPGYYTLKNSKHIYHDWKKHGKVDIYRAIVVSCDTFFYGLAQQLGIESIADILHQFGFGSLTGIDLAGELAGLIPTPEWKKHTYQKSWYPGDTLSAGIGQGYLLATPLQMAYATAMLAMRGNSYQPHLLLKAETHGEAPLNFIPSEHTLSTPIKPLYWQTVIHSMEGVIKDPAGTGGYRFGRDAPYRIAGKTGTAQKISLEKFKIYQNKIPNAFKDDTLFIAFAPVEDPQIAIAVVAENNPEAPRIARKIIDHYLKKQPLMQNHA